MKLSVLVLFLLALTGCGALSEAGPTPQVSTPLAQTSPELPTARAPASTSTTALAGATPAAPTALPTLAPTEASTSIPATSTPTPTVSEAVTVASIPSVTSAPAAFEPAFTYPIGLPGRVPGDGFFIRHGYGSENTWYNPGHWHTGEDWYAQEGDTAGAEVYAIAGGEVVYAGANYPGRVVIVRHADVLFSMYGHLDPALAVRAGQQVERGMVIGTVLRRGDKVPNHLHFEIRTFLTTNTVNGDTPRYGFRCGVRCPPGPGYWPIDAPDHPSDQGWRNPIHVIAGRGLARTAGSEAAVIVATQPAAPSVTLWSAPPSDGEPRSIGDLALHPGERFALIDVRVGAEDTHETSAQSYQLWYAIRLADGRSGWVQVAVSSTFETGADGRPSSISFNFYPAVSATP